MHDITPEYLAKREQEKRRKVEERGIVNPTSRLSFYDRGHQTWETALFEQHLSPDTCVCDLSLSTTGSFITQLLISKKGVL